MGLMNTALKVTRVQNFQGANAFFAGHHQFIERRVEFTLDGAPHVAIKTHAQRFEVYSVDRGMETFLGYVSAVAATAPRLAMAAIEALVAVSEVSSNPGGRPVRLGGRARYNAAIGL
jgi:hypothetical protein